MAVRLCESHDPYKMMLQARASGNEALGIALTANMSNPASRLGMQCWALQLLHLLPLKVIYDQIRRNPGLLLKLLWKHMAIRRPDVTIGLMKQTLGSADNAVALQRRWFLVRLSL